MEGLLIRAMEPDDSLAVTALFNQRRVAAGTLQVPLTAVAERQNRYMQSPNLRLLVAVHDGKIIGQASLQLFERRRKHVGAIGMAVDESYQGLGVGTKLMEALMDLADNWYNLARVELQVYTDNAAGIRLYEKFGFDIEGTHRAYAFREGSYTDALTMARIRNV